MPLRLRTTGQGPWTTRESCMAKNAVISTRHKRFGKNCLLAKVKSIVDAHAQNWKCVDYRDRSLPRVLHTADRIFAWWESTAHKLKEAGVLKFEIHLSWLHADISRSTSQPIDRLLSPMQTASPTSVRAMPCPFQKDKIAQAPVSLLFSLYVSVTVLCLCLSVSLCLCLSV